MEKLGLTEDDLRKPNGNEIQENDENKKKDFMGQFHEKIGEILSEENALPQNIKSIKFPFKSLKSGSSKDEIDIDWAKDDDDSDPSGPTASPQLLKADDYEKENILEEAA